MQRAVIYARYSSDRQREESIAGQIRECTEYAKRNKMEVVNTYIDRAFTAKTDHRPGFQQMIQDSEKRIFDYIIVYKLDRFVRNRYDSAMYKHKLKKFGVKVLSAMENIGDDPSSIILESVIEGMDEYYSIELAQKVTRGMTENALEGKWGGGHLPLGLKLTDDKHLVIDPIGAQAVQIIYDLYLKGHTIRHIIDYLNDHHYKTIRGTDFSRSSIDVILQQERYTGVFKWT